MAMNNMENDGRVVKPTYQKWINRVDILKKIELCARVDSIAPTNAITTAKLVKSLKDFTILPDHIEARWIDLKGDFENYKDTVVPPLVNEDEKLKTYVEWQIETLNRVKALINRISKDVDMALLHMILLRLINSVVFYERGQLGHYKIHPL